MKLETRTETSRDNWRTPSEIIALVKRIFDYPIDLDPCAAPDPKFHFATENYSGETGEAPFITGRNGLKTAWTGNVFINPPYGKAIRLWIDKGYFEYIRANTVSQIWLVPARPGSHWWANLLRMSPLFAVLNGRLKFDDQPASAGFPSALFIATRNKPTIKRFVSECTESNWTLYRKVYPVDSLLTACQTTSEI